MQTQIQERTVLGERRAKLRVAASLTRCVLSPCRRLCSVLLRAQAPKIDITGVKPSVLLNVGLLTCTLFNGSTQIVEVKIMTQVTKKKDGSLARVMFDPLA